MTKKVLVFLLPFFALAAISWVAFSKAFHRSTSDSARSTTNSLNKERVAETLNTDPAIFAAAADSLSRSASAEDSRASLAQLQIQLDRLDAKSASLVVRQYLESGADTPCLHSFKLASKGQLKDAPSLRLFLLDYLIQIDPQAAAAYAENIFRLSHSPDEWAIGLRAYALGNTSVEGKEYLRRKAREMFQIEEWRARPSVGFLEAFDVVVYTRDTGLTPDLAGWAQQTENRALAHAAYLTLDRLLQTEPVEILGQLQSRPELLAGREAARADLFSRADVRDARQRELLESYLLAPNRTATEWKQFESVYPNANYMVSHNLITPTHTPAGDEIAARDRAALRVTEAWLSDPRFAAHAQTLAIIRDRLKQFVETPVNQGTRAVR